MSEWKEKPDAPGLWWADGPYTLGYRLCFVDSRAEHIDGHIKYLRMLSESGQSWSSKRVGERVLLRARFQIVAPPVEDAPRQMSDAQIQARVEARKPPARSGADAEGKG